MSQIVDWLHRHQLKFFLLAAGALALVTLWGF